MDTYESINMDLPLPVPETNMEKSDMLVTTSENSNSLIEVLISDLKESITRNQERLTDLEELIKQRTFTTEEKEKLVKLLRQVKADGGLCERVEKLECFFKIEKSDQVSETKTELEPDHTSASCATSTVIAESEPAHTQPTTISDALHELVAKLEVIASEITPTRPLFRSRGQSFAKYRVRTNSQLSSASSGVGFSHEFEDLDYPLSRSGSFAQPTMSPVPPADGDQTSIEWPRARTTSVSIQDSSLSNLVSAIDNLATAIKDRSICKYRDHA